MTTNEQSLNDLLNDRYDAFTLFRFGDSIPTRRLKRPSMLLTSIEKEAIALAPTLEDIEDLKEFPCGVPNCRAFSPHLWLPDFCRVCFKKQKKRRTEVVGNIENLQGLNDFQSWQMKHKLQCDLIRESLSNLPLVENVMFKTVLNMNSPGEEHELVAHIVLVDNYENYEELDKDCIHKTRAQIQLEEELRREKWRLLKLEKELLQGQQRLHEQSKRLVGRELELCKREKLVLSELRHLYETKELDAQKNNEVSKRKQELEAARLEIIRFTQHIDEQHRRMILDNETLKNFPEEQTKRLKAFKERHESLAQIKIGNAAPESEEPGPRRRRALAVEKPDTILSEHQLELQQKFEAEVGKVLAQPFIEEFPGFKLMSYDIDITDDAISLLDYPENDIFYYRENFMKEPHVYEQIETATKYFNLGRALHKLEEHHFHSHVNIFLQNEGEHVITSIRKTPDENKNLLGIIRTKLCDQPFILSDQEVRKKVSSSTTELNTKEVIAAFRRKFAIFKDLPISAISCSENSRKVKRQTALSETPKFICEDLLELDRILKVRNYKFAVIYVKEGQKKIEEILANISASSAFYQFMSLLGDKIKMKGWKGYRADLDVKNNTTCTHSYYTEWERLEIMFHVAPMLNQSSVARLVGNDVVAIIWVEDNMWNPSCIVSQVLHAQIVVKPIQIFNKPLKLRVGCVVKEGLPSSRPKSKDMLWNLDDKLRDYILKKCVNTERAAWHCQTTVRTQTRSLQEHLWVTREGQLSYIYDKYKEEAKQYKNL